MKYERKKQVLFLRYRQVAVDQNLTHTEEYARYLEGFVADLLDEMQKFALFYIGTGPILVDFLFDFS